LNVNYSLQNNVIATTATFFCDAAYTLVGSTSIQCTVAGWNGVVPVCQLANNWCNALTPPLAATGKANGTITYNNGTNRRLGDTATVSCTGGSTLTGTSGLTCDIDQNWSAAVGTCDLIANYCIFLNVTIVNVTYSSSNYFLGDTATFTCPSKYNLVGTATINCVYFNQTNGRWSANSPLCQLAPTPPTSEPIAIASGQDPMHQVSMLLLIVLALLTLLR